jgi:hypothetical protein
MPDAWPPASDTRPQAAPVTSVSGSVNINVQCDGNTGGDVVGCTVEQISTHFTQISSTFQPRPFGERCLISASMLSPGQNRCLVIVPIRG